MDANTRLQGGGFYNYPKKRLLSHRGLGTRKLVTICVFDASGDQISPPIFLKTKPLEKKLALIRQEIAHIQSKREQGKPEFKKYNRKLAMFWRK